MRDLGKKTIEHWAVEEEEEKNEDSDLKKFIFSQLINRPQEEAVCSFIDFISVENYKIPLLIPHYSKWMTSTRIKSPIFVGFIPPWKSFLGPIRPNTFDD